MRALKVNTSGIPLLPVYERAGRATGRKKVRGATEMMEVKVCVSGCGDAALRVYKYPRPECARERVCVCVMG